MISRILLFENMGDSTPVSFNVSSESGEVAAPAVDGTNTSLQSSADSWSTVDVGRANQSQLDLGGRDPAGSAPTTLTGPIAEEPIPLTNMDEIPVMSRGGSGPRSDTTVSSWQQVSSVDGATSRLDFGGRAPGSLGPPPPVHVVGALENVPPQPGYMQGALTDATLPNTKPLSPVGSAQARSTKSRMWRPPAQVQPMMDTEGDPNRMSPERFSFDDPEVMDLLQGRSEHPRTHDANAQVEHVQDRSPLMKTDAGRGKPMKQDMGVKKHHLKVQDDGKTPEYFP